MASHGDVQRHSATGEILVVRETDWFGLYELVGATTKLLRLGSVPSGVYYGGPNTGYASDLGPFSISYSGCSIPANNGTDEIRQVVAAFVAVGGGKFQLGSFFMSTPTFNKMGQNYGPYHNGAGDYTDNSQPIFGSVDSTGRIRGKTFSAASHHAPEVFLEAKGTFTGQVRGRGNNQTITMSLTGQGDELETCTYSGNITVRRYPQ